MINGFQKKSFDREVGGWGELYPFIFNLFNFAKLFGPILAFWRVCVSHGDKINHTNIFFNIFSPIQPFP